VALLTALFWPLDGGLFKISLLTVWQGL